ncbi:MAG: type II toxin-antitoxin system HicA family toxin [Deltaproteobacteria bacterium]|nr:type II toxin-antitoxin system HicA family toxin [Deltaproteobacteria bacterium]
MPKSYSSHELIRIATDHGWTLDRIKGSHHLFTHPTRPGLVNIPHPRKDIPIGTARCILRQIGAAG